MWLMTRMYLLVAVMFGLLYAFMVAVAGALGLGNFLGYAVLATVMLFIQYMLGPFIVGWAMGIRWVSEKEEPELHRVVAELARGAGLPKPKVGVSRLSLPNAFAYGRSQGDARVVVTQGLRSLLSGEELKAVLGHEVSHIKHRDMVVLTVLSVVPLILWYLARGLMWNRAGGDRRGGAAIALLGLVALLLYFLTNLLVLYASRLREYYADQGSVRLGSRPQHLATAFYKLVYGSARAPKEELRRVAGAKAFFVNDPSRSLYEFKELREVDADLSGTIDTAELAAVRTKEIKLGWGDRVLEAMSTHPNMLRRVKHLSEIMFAPHD